jgi:hypothetical protein
MAPAMTDLCSLGTPVVRKARKNDSLLHELVICHKNVEWWFHTNIMSKLAKLGMESAHRRAMLRNMVTSLIKHETILVRSNNSSDHFSLFLFLFLFLIFPPRFPPHRPLYRKRKLRNDSPTKWSRWRKPTHSPRAAAPLPLFLNPPLSPSSLTCLVRALPTRPGGYTSLKLTSRRPHDAAPLAFLSFLPDNHPTRLERIAAKKALPPPPRATLPMTTTLQQLRLNETHFVQIVILLESIYIADKFSGMLLYWSAADE